MAAREVRAGGSPRIQVDGITLLGRLREPEAFAGRLLRSAADGPVSSIPAEKHFRMPGGYDRGWVYSGLLLQTTGPAAYGCMPPVRIEINCQFHDGDVLQALVSEMYDLTVSRSDIAVDYALQLPDYVRLDPALIGKSASSIEMRLGRGGAIETIYLGKLRGPRCYRIYDKALERRRAGEDAIRSPWWRVEAQLRYPAEPIPANAFSGLAWISKASLATLSPKDQLALAALAGDVSLRSQLSTGTMKRLRRLAREASSEFPPQGTDSPSWVLASERGRLLNEFDAMLGVSWPKAAKQKSAVTGDCKTDSRAGKARGAGIPEDPSRWEKGVGDG